MSLHLHPIDPIPDLHGWAHALSSILHADLAGASCGGLTRIAEPLHPQHP